jgi:protein-tyrosine-phosphatase/DNA-binding transcriptional ArsR family regulator
MKHELNAEIVTRASIHAALADPARLAIVDRLSLSDASPSEIQRLLSMPSNLVAHHLAVLEKAGVVRRVRSEGDRRRTYACINTEPLEAMMPALAQHATRVLFVCTQNSARSQLASAIWNRRSSLPTASAGTHPAAEVHPGAVAAARRRDLPMPPRAPRHIDEVLAPGDFIVCDSAHEELPANLPRIHWAIPDPARTPRRDAFDRVIDALMPRISHLARRLQPNQGELRL